MERFATAALVALAIFAGGCEGFKKTHSQVIIVLDADEEVRAAGRLVRLEVYGDYSPYPSQLVHEEEFATPDRESWQRTFALAPAGGDAERKYRFEIIVYSDESGAEEVLRRRGYGWYSRERVETLNLMLEGDCIEVMCPNRERTCEQGRCVDADLDFHGRHRSCTEDAHCDDSVECTEDACVDGYCARAYDDSACGSDEACVSWGCERGWLAFVCEPYDVVRGEKLCNGEIDCANGDDENICRRGFVCEDETRRFIPFEKLCDGIEDCMFGDDEASYICPDGENVGRTACPSYSGEGVEIARLCDGTPDCEDESDEASWFCFQQAVCASGDQWFYPFEICDGTPNCDDGSDEERCVTIHGGF